MFFCVRPPPWDPSMPPLLLIKDCSLPACQEVMFTQLAACGIWSVTGSESLSLLSAQSLSVGGVPACVHNLLWLTW